MLFRSEEEENEGKTQEEIAANKFFEIVNQVGTKDDVVVHEYGEGKIYREVGSDEMVAREYCVSVLECEDAMVKMEYEDERVNSISITLDSDDIEFYKSVLDEMLGGTAKEVSIGSDTDDMDIEEIDTIATGYKWPTNNCTTIISGEMNPTNKILEVTEKSQSDIDASKISITNIRSKLPCIILKYNSALYYKVW